MKQVLKAFAFGVKALRQMWKTCHWSSFSPTLLFIAFADKDASFYTVFASLSLSKNASGHTFSYFFI
jgi:hypothetical protein